MAKERRALPTARLKLPYILLAEDYTLTVQEFTNPGHWDRKRRLAAGVSGTAWLRLCGGEPPTLPVMQPIAPGYIALANRLQVVAHVTDPQTQISLEAARRVKKDIQAGQSLDLEVAVTHDLLREIVAGHAGIEDWIFNRHADEILVQFDNVTIELMAGKRNTGRLVDGEATYPTKHPVPRVIRHEVAGFTLVIDAFSLSPRGLLASLRVELPAGIGSAADCGPATLTLERVRIPADCQICVEQPSAVFGPWILNDAGLAIEGTGYTLDLSLSASPPGRPLSWRGLLLAAGEASGAALVPVPSNTGYLAGKYDFRGATVTAGGLTAHLELAAPHAFDAANPLGYTLGYSAGYLDVADNRITGGALGPGDVVLPVEAACCGRPRTRLSAHFDELIVQDDLDLAGEVTLKDDMGWGELTHPGNETMPWLVSAHNGYFYLPAGPQCSFNPDTGAGFSYLAVAGSAADSLLALEMAGAAGITCNHFDNLRIYSPDRPGGPANPLVVTLPEGWLHAGSRGVDGELWVKQALQSEPLGEPARAGVCRWQAVPRRFARRRQAHVSRSICGQRRLRIEPRRQCTHPSAVRHPSAQLRPHGSYLHGPSRGWEREPAGGRGAACLLGAAAGAHG